MKANYVFMWVNLQNFLIFNSDMVSKGINNPIALIGHVSCKNIVIDPVYWDDSDVLLDIVEENLSEKITRNWVVKCSDGFYIDTWDNLLIKKYKLG